MKYQLAEWLFSKELDEAYEMGLREGTDVTLSNLRFRIGIYGKDLTPARKQGYEKAARVVENYGKWTN